MALPSSGVMKASMIQTELKETGSWSINAPTSRKLAKVPTGTIKFSDFYGKSAENVVEFWVRGIWNTGFYYGWGEFGNRPKIETEDGQPVTVTIAGRDFTLRKTMAYADETNNSFTFSSLQNIDIPLNWGYDLDCTMPDGTVLKCKETLKFSRLSDYDEKYFDHRNGLIGGSSFMWGTGDNMRLFENTINHATETNPIDLKFRLKIYEY